MTTKATLNARVRITTGPAANLYGRIAHVDEALWRADVALDDGRKIKNIQLKHCELIAEETVTDRTKLLDRIRKIWMKAESLKTMGPAYEQEALTFAAEAQKMLAKYKLSLSDLEMEAMEREEPIGEEAIEGERKTRVEDWVRALAYVVAGAHFCRAIMEKGSDRVWIVGRPTDRSVCMFIFTTLRRAADEMSDKAARTFRKQQRRAHGETTHENRGYRNAWLAGFVERIAERYREENRKMETEQKKSGGTSLVLVRKNAEVAIERFVNANIPLVNTRSRRPRSGRGSGESAHHTGREDGRAAANTVNIRGTGLGASKSSSRKQLEG
jgi:hypothetical protein